MNELHEAALDYHRRKLPITLCRGKQPIGKGWQANAGRSTKSTSSIGRTRI